MNTEEYEEEDIYDAVAKHRKESGYNELEDESNAWLKTQTSDTFYFMLKKAFQEGYIIAKNKYKTILIIFLFLFCSCHTNKMAQSNYSYYAIYNHQLDTLTNKDTIYIK